MPVFLLSQNVPTGVIAVSTSPSSPYPSRFFATSYLRERFLGTWECAKGFDRFFQNGKVAAIVDTRPTPRCCQQYPVESLPKN